MSTTATTTATTASPGAAARPAPDHPRAGLRLTWLNPTYLVLDARRVLRNRRTLIFTIAMPVVFFFVFGAGQGDPDAKAYIMISLGVYGAMVAATSVGASVAVERAGGWSRQLRLTPLRPSSYVMGKVLTATAIALLPILVEFAVGAASGVRLSAADWVLSGLLAWVGSLVFAAFGLAVGYLVPSENAMQIVGAVMSILAMLGGLFVPLSAFPHLMQEIARFTPAYGVGVLARFPLMDSGWLPGAVLNVAAWTAVFSLAAGLLFRRDTARV
ncbi:ABC transporter permease [Kineococcus gynurae]|uniref:ABC transporter permease n=1 Tax=Kineococcus gynurae TaxID=452979 RepID=A0ABV5LQA7_9ACTN